MRNEDRDFALALDKNAAAMAVVRAMNDRDRDALAEKARAIRDPKALDAFVDAIAGWQEGHPPYQL